MKKLFMIGVLSMAIAGYSAIHFIPNPKNYRSDREFKEAQKEYEQKYRDERMLELMEESVRNQSYYRGYR